MKRKFTVILFIISILPSCSVQDIESISRVNEDDCLITFKMSGEINAIDAPLTKSSSDDLYFVQTFRGSSPFSSGIYDDPDKIKIHLKKGTEKYRIIVSLIKNGKILIGNNYQTSTNSVLLKSIARLNYSGVSYLDPGTISGITQGNYQSILYWLQEYRSSSSNGVTQQSGVTRWVPLNSSYNNITNYSTIGVTKQTKWTYNKKDYANNLEIQFYNIENTCIEDVIYPQCDDWFYAEVNNYSPTGNYESLTLNLKRVGFKLKYELSGVTDGEVSVKVYKNSRYFIENTSNTTSYSSVPVFYAFHDAHSAWLYADDYMENFTLSVSWLRGIGITEDYGTKTIQLKRNCLNNIKINLGSNDQSAGMNLTVEAENTIGAESVTIPVQ